MMASMSNMFEIMQSSKESQEITSEGERQPGTSFGYNVKRRRIGNIQHIVGESLCDTDNLKLISNIPASEFNMNINDRNKVEHEIISKPYNSWGLCM